MYNIYLVEHTKCLFMVMTIPCRRYRELIIAIVWYVNVGVRIIIIREPTITY